MLRVEYNQYCRWVADQLESVVFDRRVIRVEHDSVADTYVVTTRAPSDGALRFLMSIGIALVLTLMLFALGNDLFCP